MIWRAITLLVALALTACQADPQALPTAEVAAPQAEAGPRVVRVSRTFQEEFDGAYRALSEGDRSTLAAVLHQENAALLTVANSANDRFWLLMVREGWAVAAPVDAQISAQLPSARS